MQQDRLLLYDIPPSRRQTRLCLAVSAILLAVVLAILPFAETPLPRFNVFVPMVDTVLFVGDLITATLLFTQASVLRSRELVALATGYLFTGLIIVPHALTLPGAFSATGLLGAGVDTTAWLFIFWHWGLAVPVIAYAYLGRESVRSSPEPRTIRTLIYSCIAGSIALAALLTVLAIAQDSPLPKVMIDAIRWSPDRLLAAALTGLALLAIALLLLWRRRSSILDLWLMVSMWAWLLEVFLLLQTSSRYSLAWYSSRFAAMLAGLFVLLGLLAQTSRLYAQLALSVLARQREREGRALSMDAVAASIAHEVKQPLAAMVTNANAARRWLDRTPPDVDRAAEILQAIADDGHRAADLVTGMRSVYGAPVGERGPLRLQDLVRETTVLFSRELAAHRIALQMDLADNAGQVAANRLQLQQVLLNLFANAVDAMAGVDGRKRELRVTVQGLADGTAEVSVRDTGIGIDPVHVERMFDAFFTTKEEGTGMGLPLCRSIVEAHGGRIWATPTEPFGTAFHFHLPAVRANQG